MPLTDHSALSAPQLTISCFSGEAALSDLCNGVISNTYFPEHNRKKTTLKIRYDDDDKTVSHITQKIPNFKNIA